jgi:aspartate beta-hydroxylase
MTNPAIEAALVRASQAQQEQRFDIARKELATLLASEPGEPRAHNMLGMIALAEDKAAEARAAFERAIASDPKEPALRLNLATAARRAGDDARELAALKSAIELDQRHFMAWLRKAELHQRRAETGEAVQAWNATLALSRGIDPLPPALAEVLARGGAWLAEQNDRFGKVIDDALAQRRKALSAAERRRFDACADVLVGRRRIYTNQCEGIHYPFLPADEYFERSHFPWMEALESRTDAIRSELLALLADGTSALEPYVQQPPGTPVNLWSELDQSLDWGVFFLWNYGKRIDEACARCPETASALDLVPRVELPGRAPTAFFSILQPHKHIPPHTGVTNTRTIVHLPLIVPEGCRFRVGGETRPWVEGRAFAFDDTIEHEAWNDSDDLRAVLILDVWNPYLEPHERELLAAFCVAADASGFNPGMSDAR